MRRLRGLGALALAVLIAGLVLGCGGDDSTDSTDPTDPTDTTGSTDTTDTTGSTDTTDSTGSTDATGSTDSTETTDTTDSTEPVADGQACATAASCIQPGRICVFADVGAATTTCVDATQGVWDDGSDPDKRLVKAGNDWLRKRVDNWEAGDVRCNDGSPYGYYINVGKGEAANNWVFYFKGGSLCLDQESCGYRWLTHRHYMRQWRSSSPNYNPTLGAKAPDYDDINMGIYSRKQPTNHFRDWTYVHFHYCSSDVFNGTALAEGNPVGLYHRGNAMVEAVVTELLAGVDGSSLGVEIPSLAAAKQVLIAGGSAGATGARRNMDRMASAIRDAAPGALVRGMADSAVSPPIYPGQHELESKDAVSTYHGSEATKDLDCLEAHADKPGLCSDATHVVGGGGIGPYHGVTDDGHLGLGASTENGGVDGAFVFMAQWDGKARSGARILSGCAKRECTTHTDCAPGFGCLEGICWRSELCTPTYCTPGSEPCFAKDDPPACLNGVVVHPNVCDTSDDCGDGEVCQQGLCLENKYLGCESDDACPDGFLCSRGICLKSVTSAGECKEPGYGYVKDTNTCEQSLGCSGTKPCGEGYSCLDFKRTPNGATFAWGIRNELGGLAPWVGVFVPDNATHTAASGSKYYAHIEEGNTGKYKAQPSLRIKGTSFAEALGQWFVDPASYAELISPAAVVPVPLWAQELVDLDFPSAGSWLNSPCEYALGVAVCAASAGCDPTDALGLALIGTIGIDVVIGTTPGETQPLALVIAAHPDCDQLELSVPKGAHVSLTYLHAAGDGAPQTLKVALPEGTLGNAALPLVLYVGADGATYSDAALTQLVAKPVP